MLKKVSPSVSRNTEGVTEMLNLGADGRKTESYSRERERHAFLFLDDCLTVHRSIN
jgi:hypothetical protein